MDAVPAQDQSIARGSMSPPSGARLLRIGGRAALRIPEAFLVVVTVCVVIGVGADVLALRPFADVGASRLILSVLGLTAVVHIAWRGGNSEDEFGGASSVEGDKPAAGETLHRWDWLATLPALLLVVYQAVARLILPPGARAEWFIGGDHVRHLLFVVEEQAAGNLSYERQPYPRAWHTLITVLWTATGGRPNRQGMASLIDLMSTLTWFLPGVLSLACGSLALVVARRAGLGDRGAVAAGAAAAAGVLLPPFLWVYQALGFETSLVGAVAVAVATRLALLRPALASVVISTCAVVVVAHTWQLLLPAVGLALFFTMVRLLRERQFHASISLVLLAGAWASYSGIVAVATNVGVGHASVSEIDAPYPMVLLVLGLVAVSWLAWRVRWPDGPILGVSVALPAVTAIAICLRQRIGLDSYYPSKLLWQTAVVGLAPLATVGMLGTRHLLRGPALARRLTRPLIAVGAVVLLGYAVVSPLGAFSGSWSLVDGPRVLAALTARGASSAQVVWLGGQADDTFGRILLDFYHGGQVRTPQNPLDVAEDCRLLLAASTPTVVSDHPRDDVIKRYACAPLLQVVELHR